MFEIDPEDEHIVWTVAKASVMDREDSKLLVFAPGRRPDYWIGSHPIGEDGEEMDIEFESLEEWRLPYPMTMYEVGELTKQNLESEGIDVDVKDRR